MEPANPYTGIVSELNEVPPRPHDPEVHIWATTVAPRGGRLQPLPCGGAGWDRRSARMACLGEAIERYQPCLLPQDQTIQSSYAEWPLDEPALAPQQWPLFHPDQYRQPGFPFEPFTEETPCQWLCCREITTGEPYWAPEPWVHLFAPPDQPHRMGPSISTGLSCGHPDHPVLLRGLQELIERDGLMGSWWGAYLLEEWQAQDVLALLPSDVEQRILRPNLRYRFYRSQSPHSDHVVIVTLEGEDTEGYCFSAGSACRENRALAWNKAILEAIHGRYYVRQLKQDAMATGKEISCPTDFSEHALYYSLHPEQWHQTALAHAVAPERIEEAQDESLRSLIEQITGPVLFRNVTPPGLRSQSGSWLVLRVLAPGLQPMHGHHGLPLLGGPLWSNRPLEQWHAIPPHPFP